jgi:hypothetical protein
VELALDRYDEADGVQAAIQGSWDFLLRDQINGLDGDVRP